MTTKHGKLLPLPMSFSRHFAGEIVCLRVCPKSLVSITTLFIIGRRWSKTQKLFERVCFCLHTQLSARHSLMLWQSRLWKKNQTSKTFTNTLKHSTCRLQVNSRTCNLSANIFVLCRSVFIFIRNLSDSWGKWGLRVKICYAIIDLLISLAFPNFRSEKKFTERCDGIGKQQKCTEKRGKWWV